VIRLATVVETGDRVRVTWSGGDVTLRPSVTAGTLAVGDEVLVAIVENRGAYAVERVG